MMADISKISDIIQKYTPDGVQVEQDGELLPVWLGSKYVVKVFSNKQYFQNILLAHSVLDPIDRSSKLIESFEISSEHYVVVEEFIQGKHLQGDVGDLAVVGFYQEMINLGLDPGDWDFNPENYIIDENDNFRVKVIDLGDLFFSYSV